MIFLIKFNLEFICISSMICYQNFLVLFSFGLLLTLGHLPIYSSQACYKFTSISGDPCRSLECSFGAECIRTKDGKRAECVCPEKCYTYGDSVGSRPVCGSDGRDYPNECELRRKACNSSKEITVKFQGKCGKIIISIFFDRIRDFQNQSFLILINPFRSLWWSPVSSLSDLSTWW